MSGRVVTASKWTCASCSVSVSQIGGAPAPLPDSWVSSPEGDFCLTCRRQRAAEAALDAAPSDCDRSTRAKLRRAGLIEFEVSRTPDRTDGMIAKACRATAPAVSAARSRLQAREGQPSGPERDRTPAHAGAKTRR